MRTPAALVAVTAALVIFAVAFTCDADVRQTAGRSGAKASVQW